MSTELSREKHAKTAAIIERFRNGDKDAFEELYALHFKYVYFLAAKILGNTHQAAEVAQDAFETAYRNIATLESPMAFQKWINRVTHNLCMNILAREKNTQTVPMDEEIASNNESVLKSEEFLPEECLSNKELKEAVSKMVDSLPAKQREPIVLYYFEGLSTPDIADVMGIETGTVRKRLHDARNALKMQARNLAPSTASTFAAAPTLVITRLLSGEADAMAGSMLGSGAYTSILHAISSSATMSSKTAPATTKAVVAQKALVAVTAAAVITAGLSLVIYGRSVSAVKESTATNEQLVSQTKTHLAMSIPQNSSKLQVKSSLPTPAPLVRQETEQSTPAETPLVPHSETAPTVVVGTNELSYTVGTSVPLSQILIDANAFGVTDSAKRIPVVALLYESIDFDTPGMYPLILNAKSSSGLLSQPLALTIHINK